MLKELTTTEDALVGIRKLARDLMSNPPEAWLSGPVEGVTAYLVPVAHALVQAGRDLENATADLTSEELWAHPGGAASIGFHLKHIAGVLDRLLTYARGEELSDEQVRALKNEAEPGPAVEPVKLIWEARAAVGRALNQVRATGPGSLLEPRGVGRKRLPSTVLGLLYHAAEHATRHTGQIITTATIVRGDARARGRPG